MTKESLEMGLDLIPNLTESTLDDFMKEDPTKTTTEGKDKLDSEEETNEDINQETDEPGIDLSNQEEPPEDINLVWANFARENKFIDFKDEDYTPEEGVEFLKSKYQESIEAKAKKLREDEESQMDPFIKDLREKYREGVDIRDFLQSEVRLQEFFSIKETDIKDDINLQKEVVTTLFESQGYSPEEIKTKIQNLEDASLLEPESKISIKKLIQIETKYKEDKLAHDRAQELQRKQEILEGTRKFEENIKAKKELFPNLPFTDEMKKKVTQAILSPVSRTPKGDPINLISKAQAEDPDFLAKVAYMVINNWDLSTFQKQATTDATKKIQKTVSTFSDKKSKTLEDNAAIAIKWAKQQRKQISKLF